MDLLLKLVSSSQDAIAGFSHITNGRSFRKNLARNIWVVVNHSERGADYRNSSQCGLHDGVLAGL